MKKAGFFAWALLVAVLFVSNVHGSTVSISDLPAYDWYHGCGPTAAASIIGYYDLHGYDSLFDASGWDEVRLTSNVQDEISSLEHNTMYDPDPDLPGTPPPDTSIADFFHTSENKPYGWSWLSDSDDAFEGYANYKGYSDWNAWYERYDSFTWDDLTTQIDNNNPVMFLVDRDANGATDHFVPVLAYNDDTREYGCYTTWSESETISWHDFQGMGNNWGVGYAICVEPGAPDLAPVPSSVLLLGTALASLTGIRIRKSFKE